MLESGVWLMLCWMVLFLHDTGTTESYTYCNTISRHDALTCSAVAALEHARGSVTTSAATAATTLAGARSLATVLPGWRSEEHTSELQSLMRIAYAVFCLKKINKKPSTFTNLPCLILY